MKTQITLETKEVRAILARFFGLPEERIIPLRYSFAIEGMTAEEIKQKLNNEKAHGG